VRLSGLVVLLFLTPTLYAITISITGKEAGITLGTNFRLSAFFDDPVIFESIMAFEGYVNFYNTEKFRIGLRGSNFNDFTAGNFGALGVPCYPVIGNHDIYFGNWPVWRDMIGSTRFRIDHRNTTLFILDSANAAFGAAQLNWLRNELPTAKNHVFVFTHTNLFVRTPGDIGQITDIRERVRIMSILKGRAEAMLMGHVHQRIIREAGGVNYITIEDFKDNSTYCRVHVSPGGMWYEFEKL
jgi:hypothetical protein